MASLGGTSSGKWRNCSTSFARASASSPSDTSEIILLINQNDQDKLSMKVSFDRTTEIQDSQSDNEPDNASCVDPIHDFRTIVQNDFIKRLVGLGKEYFDRHLQVQRNSAFWVKLFNASSEAEINHRPPLVSREWAEYVVDASRVFFEAKLSVKKVVSLIHHAIRFAAIYLLNRGTERIYFEDGRNVFYDSASRGMPNESRTKYKAFLEGMRATILSVREEVMSNSEPEVIPESGDGSSSDVGEFSQLEGTISTTESAGHERTADPLPWKRSTTPTEVKASTLKAEDESDNQAQAVGSPPQTERNRDRKRQNLKRKERRKRSIARLRAESLSLSRDTTASKVEKRRRWRQNRKRKEKIKKANAAARQTAEM